MENKKADAQYESGQPFLFISYSHSDQPILSEVMGILDHAGVPFWYDNGLHSGDDWNLIIARRLSDSAACLLLLSPNSAASDYVKNELNFALNHRIPIHVLLTEDFSLPMDVEIMIGRIQMVRRQGDYGPQLLQALPPELFGNAREKDETKYQHPLFERQRQLFSRQGTESWLGRHKTLGYELLIQQEPVISANLEAAHQQAVLAARLHHPLFPRIFDIQLIDGVQCTYQEYRGEQFLNDYLAEHTLTEAQITQWLLTVTDAMAYLFNRNLALRDFARGSLTVSSDGGIGLFRLQSLYYGVFALRPDNKDFYFNQIMQEIAVLLCQLCTGQVPTLPFPILTSDRYSKRFMDKMNLIVQRCAKEHGAVYYDSFQKLMQDLQSDKITLQDRLFLRKRAQRLAQYQQQKAANLERFTSGDPTVTPRRESLEEQFGLDRTVAINDTGVGAASIRILICSTGQLLEFSQQKIILGRDATLCQMVLTQPTLSRRHAEISRTAEGYLVKDLMSSNGITLADTNERLSPGQSKLLPPGSTIIVGQTRLQLLDA